MESICRGELRRPLHFKELLLPAILKWADWSEEDRKDNQLVFGRHPVIDQLFTNDKVCHQVKSYHISLILKFQMTQSLPAKSVFEIHYSSPKSKSFRQCPFEFCQARFTLLKDLKVCDMKWWFLQQSTHSKYPYRITPFTDVGISSPSFGILAEIPSVIHPPGKF